MVSCASDEGISDQKKVSRSKVGIYKGFTYEFWNQNEKGSPVMTLKPDGTFDVKWNGIYNMLARNGVRPGINVNSVTYNVDQYRVSGGVSYLCVYGWAYDSGTYNNMVEFYIVDNWKNFRPPGNNGTFKGSVNVDGAVYDIYTDIRVNKPSVHPSGVSTFTQYWSVRRDGDQRSAGTIDVKAHFNAWDDLGMQFGNTMREVSFCIEGFEGGSDGSGYANVSRLEFNTE